MKKKCKALLAGLVSLAMLTACGASGSSTAASPAASSPASGTSGSSAAASDAAWPEDVQEIVDRGVLRVGVKNAVPGFGYQDPLTSEYSGIHFYASHLVEMATEIFGFAVQSVYAQQKKDGITAIFEYEDKNIVLSFLSSKKYACYIIEPDKTEMFKIDTDNLAELGVKDFMHAIRTGTPQNPPINLYRYTVLVNAIKDSMDSGKQVIPELKL